MGRPRCFDREKALDRAMKVFWVKGYEATSLQDLLAELEINNSSFYQTFKSKQELFDEVLNLYVERRSAARRKILTGPGSVRTILTRFFNYLISVSLEENNPGCLVTNTSVAFKRNPSVAKVLTEAFRRLESNFCELLKREMKEELSQQGDRSVRVTARMLVSVVYGLNVLARICNDRAILEDVANRAIDAVFM